MTRLTKLPQIHRQIHLDVVRQTQFGTTSFDQQPQILLETMFEPWRTFDLAIRSTRQGEKWDQIGFD